MVEKKYSRGKNPNSRNGFKKGNQVCKGKHWKYSGKTKKEHRKRIKNLYKICPNMGYQKGHIPWNKDKIGVYSKETLNRFSKWQLGEKNPNWQGGISFEPYSANWTETLRRSIRERDNYTCQIPDCGKTQIEELEEIERKLCVHHIDYNKKNCNPDNLITLCFKCHGKTNRNKKYWKQYFQNLWHL